MAIKSLQDIGDRPAYSAEDAQDDADDARAAAAVSGDVDGAARTAAPRKAGLRAGKTEAAKRLRQFAAAGGNISDLLTDAELSMLGSRVCDDYEMDLVSTKKWRDDAKNALDAAAQDDPDAKNYPFENASNVQYPSLTVAAQQFAARAYPAIIKNDEAVGVKVLGPIATGPVGHPNPGMGHNGGPAGPMPGDTLPSSGGETGPALPGGATTLGSAPPPAAPQPGPALPTGQAPAPSPLAVDPKTARANRVKQWLNYRLMYCMDDWEGDVDFMLNQMPVTGMGFFKVYRKDGYGTVAEFVSALNLTVSMNTKTLQSCPRVTQDYPLYPYEIHERIASEEFNDVELPSDSDDDQAPRVILEQHRMHDLDGDGIEEPYIVTVDKELAKVLRIEADFGPDDITFKDEGTKDETVLRIKRWMPFIDFPFLPDPKGRFYAMGFGSLLKKISAAIDSGINQLIDAGHAEIAGGGFIAAGLRIQGPGQTSNLRFKPGEYKTVNVPGGTVRDAIFERTMPKPSDVTLKMVDLLLGAAKDITSVKDVLTGDANNNAPVGTTMALIEQALQSFTAIYKRIYRSLKRLYHQVYDCESRYADEETYAAYRAFFNGDPAADFKADFDGRCDRIVPVSDPAVVTKMQQLAKAQFLEGFQDKPWSDPAAIQKRIYQAADIDNPDELIRQPPPPSPVDMANLDVLKSTANKNNADAEKAKADATKAQADAGAITGEHEANGALHAGLAAGFGRVQDLDGQPGNPMGGQGSPDAGGSASPGMAPPIVGFAALGGSPGSGTLAPVANARGA